MSLTPQQSETIREWAERAQYVREVRLFGSQARGDFFSSLHLLGPWCALL
jgi:predicted nucleotidyltransferase